MQEIRVFSALVALEPLNFRKKTARKAPNWCLAGVLMRMLWVDAKRDVI